MRKIFNRTYFQFLLSLIAILCLTENSFYAQNQISRANLATKVVTLSKPSDEVPPTTSSIKTTLGSLVESLLLSYTRSATAHGIYFENLNGKSVVEEHADEFYNPASVTKVMTSLAALDRFGPTYRYKTRIGYTGKIDSATHTLNGNLVIDSDSDPSFVYESVFCLGEKIREAGIYSVEGDLIIKGKLYINLRHNNNVGKDLMMILDRTQWNRSIEQAWNFYSRIKTANGSSVNDYQGINFNSGKVLYNDSATSKKLLLEYYSAPMLKILKVMNAYSNNEMAHLIGYKLGGASSVRDFLIQRVKLVPQDVYLETTSGLGNNTITPRGVVKVIRYALNWCEKNKVSLTDLLPIGGVDTGTLSGRFNKPELVGSIVAKTGTLSRVSALAGILYTRGRGPVLFAILQRGVPTGLRKLQQEIIALVAENSGGAQAISFGSEMSRSLIEDALIRKIKGDVSM